MILANISGPSDFWPISSDTLGRLYEVTFGGAWPAGKVEEAGERIFNIQRMYNVMAGFTGRQDTLPDRFFRELLKEGPPKDKPMTAEAFSAALQEYYALRGWDEEGRPTIQKLEELDVEPELIDAYKKTL